MVMTGDKSFQYSSYENMKECVYNFCSLNLSVKCLCATNKELRYFR